MVYSPHIHPSFASAIGTRIENLLRPLAAEPHRFRSLYRYLVQVLNKASSEKGPKNAEMNQYAATRGELELKVMTVGELSKIPDIADSDP